MRSEREFIDGRIRAIFEHFLRAIGPSYTPGSDALPLIGAFYFMDRAAYAILPGVRACE